MRSVRISWKTAQALKDAINSAGFVCGSDTERAMKELRAAVRPRPSLRKARQTKAKKRVAHNAETSDIRQEVFARAGGLCEMCKGAGPTDLQHCLGRIKRPQAVNNCLALCRLCHREATKKTQDALDIQAKRLWTMGHTQAATDLVRLADWLLSKEAARQKMKRHRAALKLIAPAAEPSKGAQP